MEALATIPKETYDDKNFIKRRLLDPGTFAVNKLLKQKSNASLANYMMDLSSAVANRGINKAPMTPAQLNGYNPQNPVLFGMQAKQPVPYQSYMTQKGNMTRAMQGYQGSSGSGGTDMSRLMASINTQKSVLKQAFASNKSPPITAPAERNPTINLYNLQKRDQRMNSIYALN